MGVPDSEADPADISVVGQVWGFYSVSKEYGIPPFLVPDIFSVHCGKNHGEPRPHLPYVAEAATFCWYESPCGVGEILIRLLDLLTSDILPGIIQ